MFSVSQPVNHIRFGFFLGLVVVGSFLVFGSLIGDGLDEGRTELACAQAKLEAMWKVPLPTDAEIVGSVPASSVASAGWDLKELGCSGRIYPAATLQLRE